MDQSILARLDFAQSPPLHVVASSIDLQLELLGAGVGLSSKATETGEIILFHARGDGAIRGLGRSTEIHPPTLQPAVRP